MLWYLLTKYFWFLYIYPYNVMCNTTNILSVLCNFVGSYTNCFWFSGISILFNRYWTSYYYFNNCIYQSLKIKNIGYITLCINLWTFIMLCPALLHTRYTFHILLNKNMYLIYVPLKKASLLQSDWGTRYVLSYEIRH